MARLSPDGRMLAVAIGGTTAEEIWTYDIARNALSQLTYDSGSDPVWSADGSRVIFTASREGLPDLFWKQTDRSAVEERLTRSRAQEDPAFGFSRWFDARFCRREREHRKRHRSADV